jgi:superfamily II DNA or RNA helicase
MTTPTRILKKDEVHVVIDAERSVLREIYDHFSFQIPNAKFDPRVKNKIWDGFIRILNLKTREFYVGLVPELCKFLKKNGYEYVLDSDIIVGDYFTPIDFERITEALETVYEARDYQQNAVSRCINEGRALVLASTGSGKSFIQYLVSSYYRAKGLRTLLIVPTQSLVEQMYKDFESYSPYKPLMQKIMSGYEKELSAHYTFTLENGNTCTYEGNERIKVLESGEKKIEKSAKMITRKDRIAYADVNDGYAKILKIEELSSEITIATWQSIHRLDQSWFDLYNVVMCDECHLATARSISDIMTKMTKTKYRFGFTGSLKDSKCDSMVLTGLFGPVYQATTTKDLMDRDYLAKLVIHPIVFKHNDDEISAMKQVLRENKKKFDYNAELEYLIGNEKRNRAIAKLAISLKKNTLILFERVDTHGKLMYDILCELTDKNKVYFIHGKVGVDEREEVREVMEKNDGIICVASSGVFSTGINIRNLHGIIFSALGKSKIRVIQSIGRSLRLHETKDHARLFDISDDLRAGTKSLNYSLKHFNERLDLYTRENFELKSVQVINL